MNRAILWAALTFTALFAFLTVFVVVTHGPSVLTLFSLLVLAMFGFGVLGALRDRPR